LKRRAAASAGGDGEVRLQHRLRRAESRGVPVQTLACSIPNFYGIGRMVVDRTGLTGGYDMDMDGRR
jgi:uncharacterized protein (TIGR03435 family)